MVNLKKACPERTHSTTLKVRPEFVEGQSRRVFIRTFGVIFHKSLIYLTF